MHDTTNSVERLHHLLSAARQGVAEEQHHYRTGVVWGDVLGAPRDDERALIRKVAHFRDLVEEAIQAAAIAEPNRTRVLWEDAVRAAVSPYRLGNPWRDTVSFLTDEVMQELSISVRLVSATRHERCVPDNELRRLLSAVDEVLEMVFASGGDAEFRKTLVRHLEGLRDAVLDYRIRGASVISEAVEKAVGTAAINGEKFDQHRESPELRGFWRVMYEAIQCTNFAFDVQQITEFIGRTLPPV